MSVDVWTAGPVVVGCGNFGGIGGAKDLIGRGLDETAAFEVLDEAVGHGITLLDTAERYADGASEEMIGRWLADRGPSITGDMRVSTKVAPPFTRDDDSPFDSAFIEPIFEGSLERLGVDRVEWLLIHAPDPATPAEMTLEAMVAIRESGRCGRIGACNLDVEELSRALDAADRLGVVGYEVVQNWCSLLDPDADADARALCRERSIAFTAYSPLAGGVMTGKYSRDSPPPEGSRLALRPEGFDEMLTPAVHDALDHLEEVAAARGVSMGALALAWLLAHDEVTAIIAGPSSTAPHLGLVGEALEIDLDRATHEALTERFRAATAST
jgi:aryl-alcohol dehydrogenase-like predicted oxidoreductase